MDNLNKLAKWRSVLAGWQLGTRAKGDPESDAVRDHREATLIIRAELSALVALLINKGVISVKEFNDAFDEAAVDLDQAYEKKFPGFKTSENGVQIDVKIAQETMRGWRP